MRFVPVPHADNAAGYEEEARVVAGLVADLCPGTWTDKDGGVATPGPAARSPEQLRRVNALCRYAEVAGHPAALEA